ncbi:MAG: NAD(P)H-binding protein [Solirubrobacterales bacterium]|nr:NAD(P)H-binding protein [Solirubrobacterales bacterium]
MIFVTGATGNAGGAVIRALVNAGEQVRGLVRDADRALLPAGVEPVVGDLNEPRTLVPHFEGVTAAFLLSGYKGLEETLGNMRRAGVERVVLLSSSAAPTADLTNAVARYHILSEQAVRQSGLGWTFLQPNTFMTNTLQWTAQLRHGDVIRAPFRRSESRPSTLTTLRGGRRGADIRCQ